RLWKASQMATLHAFRLSRSAFSSGVSSSLAAGAFASSAATGAAAQASTAAARMWQSVIRARMAIPVLRQNRPLMATVSRRIMTAGSADRLASTLVAHSGLLDVARLGTISQFACTSGARLTGPATRGGPRGPAGQPTRSLGKDFEHVTHVASVQPHAARI